MKAYRIRNKTLDFPLIQGGMGVGVSLGNLAGHVAKEGCMGVISGVQIGYRKEDFYRDNLRCNKEALKEEVQKARSISDNRGMVAVNIMVAGNQYEEMLKSALESGVDAIISGAGLPMAMPKIAQGYDVALAPIVSGGKAAKVVMNSWLRKENRFADFVVLEGRGAGGHLGFHRQEIDSPDMKLEKLLQEVLEVVKTFEDKKGSAIPVFIAGSVFDGYEMAYYAKRGAFGAQIGTRFIATYECDASEEFSKLICQAKKEDVIITQSPVGLPGRALKTKLLEQLEHDGRIPPKRCIDCLKPCNPTVTPYCISEALIQAAKGNIEQGLFFTGENVDRINKMYHVHDLIEELKMQWEETI
ncbi:MAG: NAD(P)H-dependent flavin oxidoreductase [Filifactor alocis]|uniref:NAD(P)H-dependent flavin oxidoreductase n=1 Tax=Filifactor alocis TaxID=143361 RepID=UPI003F9FC6A0